MTDRGTIRVIVFSVALLSFIGLVGALALAYLGKEIPESLWPIMGGIMAALPTLLSRISSAPEPTPEPAPPTPPQ